MSRDKSFAKPKFKANKSLSLRVKAEELLTQGVENTHDLSPENAEALIHELQTHKIELKMQNAALRKSEEQLIQLAYKYRSLFYANPLGCVIVDQQGTILEANPTMGVMLDIKQDELLNKPFSAYISTKADADKFHIFLRSIFKSQDPQECMLSANKTGMPPINMQVTGALQYSEIEESLKCILTISDVTSILNSEEKYRQLFNNELSAFVIVDAETFMIEEGNPAALQLFGYTIDELKNLNVLDISSEKDKTKLSVNNIKNQEPGSGIIPLRFMLKKDGTVFPAEISSSSFTTGGRKKIHGIISDISDRYYQEENLKLHRKNIEDELNKSMSDLKNVQAQLFHTSKLATLGEMATGLAHEINQPLGSIVLVIDLLNKKLKKDMLDKASAESCITDLRSSAKRIEDVIKHIRIFARQEVFLHEMLDLNATIHAAMSLLAEQLRLRDISVTLNLQGDLPQVNGESFQLEQVWINLISNAKDALDTNRDRMPDQNMVINISTVFNEQSESIEISITDNGTGLDDSIRSKIFEPFFTTKKVGTSMGLGLSICYGIIENHKGCISVSSEAGKGTTFTVTLPIY
ncbi:MAG: PAS domain S-box protein [Nitrospira sp.]|nr:PAS domain S-box protein [Nitrospira sp.]